MASTSLDSIATFGELLRYLRRRAHLTQQDLGIAVGYSAAQIARLEAGKRKPDPMVVAAHFVGALDLDHEPELAKRLTDLATTNRRGSTLRDVSTAPQAVTRSQPTNLLPQLTRFIGREQQLVEVKGLLANNRLVTLTGAGGVGKTRLAYEVAASYLGVHDGDQTLFVDGVWLVELAPIADPGLVPHAVAAGLRLPEQPTRAHADALAAYLRDKRLLLVIDNCEHVIDACAQLVEQLLRMCPGLRVLATSREPLRVPGEVAWRVPALVAPDPANLPPYERLLDYEAVQLFVETAVAVQPGFNLTPHNVAAIAQICHRLDGLPLAIEMAAAQVPAMSIDEIAAGLDDRFALLTLTSGVRTALPHHQTLHATLDWSYDLLSKPEQVLLARLYVFVGGWTADAAKSVCADPSPVNHLPAGQAQPMIQQNDILPLLLQLVRKSMATAVTRDGRTRYYLLETIRQYTGEKLRDRGEADPMRERHLIYYPSMAEAFTELGGRQHYAWMQRLDPEHDNLRTAFTRARKRDDKGEVMLRLAGALRSWLHDRGRFQEGQAWLEEALARGQDGPPVARAKALYGKASVLMKLSDFRQAAPLFEESLALYKQVHDPFGVAWASLLLSNLALSVQFDNAQAERLAERALSLFEQIGTRFGQSCALGRLGQVKVWQGERAQAAVYLERSLAIAQEVGDARQVARVLDHLRQVDQKRGLKLWKHEVARLRGAGDLEPLATILQWYGWTMIAKGDYSQARTVLQESLELWQQLGERWTQAGGTGSAALALGYAERLLGNMEPAAQRLDQCSQVSSDVGDVYQVNHTQWMMASVLMRQGECAKARGYLCESLRQFRERADWLEVTLVLAQMADLAQTQGDMPLAVRLAGAVAPFADKFIVSRLQDGIQVDYLNTLN
ncbi:MAG: tetratricopeptide repeat protein, partial [Chloroflexi bacterium]|nr:tetratricopeptide repeat protein [Chloroflexota bacterium]